jgi:hypothetical protein
MIDTELTPLFGLNWKSAELNWRCASIAWAVASFTFENARDYH